MATNTDVITAIHAKLDAELILAGGIAIDYGIGAKERAKNSRPPRIVWDDSGVSSTISKLPESGTPNPQAIAFDRHGWEVVLWSTTRDACEALLHAFVGAARRTYATSVVRFSTYRPAPEAYSGKGFAVVLDATIELPVDPLTFTAAFVNTFDYTGLLLPDEEVIIHGVTEVEFDPAFDGSFS